MNKMEQGLLVTLQIPSAVMIDPPFSLSPRWFLVITKLMDVFIKAFDESVVLIDDACLNEILFG